jgi:hypothetical protein
MVLSWVALIIFPEPIPPEVTLLIIGYFVVVEGYAAFAFLRGTLATGGPTRWRLSFAAAGSLLLAVIILLAGVEILVPGIEGLLDRTISFLPVLAGVCYYLGFVPPGWLRRAWQLPELHRFLACYCRSARPRTLHQGCPGTMPSGPPVGRRAGRRGSPLG